MITKEQVLENLDKVKEYIQEAEKEKSEEKKVGVAIKTIFGSIKFQEFRNCGINLFGHRHSVRN